MKSVCPITRLAGHSVTERRRIPQNPVICVVDNPKVTGQIESHGSREVQSGLTCGLATAIEAGLTDYQARGHSITEWGLKHQHTTIEFVGDPEVTGCIKPQTDRAVEPGLVYGPTDPPQLKLL